MRARAVVVAPSFGGQLADFAELAKPGITFMVLVTTATGFLLGNDGRVPVGLLLLALLGTGLVSAGGSALNHLLERDTDALMQRTAGRPLPAGRMLPERALLFGALLSGAGLALLAITVNWLTALLGAVALAGYVVVYTPLKRVTSLATIIGAIPGAIPPVMGWAAARNDLHPGAWALFGILFFWQLPHFLAIAWLCRVDYAQAGFPMLAVLEPDGRSTARQMVLYGAALLPVSLLPSVLGLVGWVYFAGALLLGVAFLAACVSFSFSHSTRAARNILLMSVFYLPAVLAVMLLDRMI